MKKLLKIVALCSCFVLLLSIMLISNIPKTYANSSVGSEPGEAFNSDIFYNPYSAFSYGFYAYDAVDEEIIPTLIFSGPRSFSALSVNGGDEIIPNSGTGLSNQAIRYNFSGYINGLDGSNLGVMKPDVYYSQDPGYAFVAYWDKLFFDFNDEYVDVNTYYFYCDVAVPQVVYGFDYFNFETGLFDTITYMLTDVPALTPIPVFNNWAFNNRGGLNDMVLVDYTIGIIMNTNVSTNIHIVQTMFNNRTYIAQIQRNNIHNVWTYGVAVNNPTEPFDVGEWLLNNINSFLDFELVPGFSLASLLALMVGIPLLLWLFKMLFGG